MSGLYPWLFPVGLPGLKTIASCEWKTGILPVGNSVQSVTDKGVKSVSPLERDDAPFAKTPRLQDSKTFRVRGTKAAPRFRTLVSVA